MQNDLISRSALKKTFEDAELGEHSLIESVLAAGVYAGIDNAPTIDAAPVVHAYWMDGIICSHCRSTKARPWAAYLEQRANTFCHVCGAKMDGGAEG